MKLTWFERPDGSWHARYLSAAATHLEDTYHVTAREQHRPAFPWRWEIRQDGNLVLAGESSDEEGARMSAHLNLAHHIAPAKESPVFL